MGGMVEEGGNTTKVRVDGEEAVLHLTDQSVMFEKEGRLSGFERSAIRMVKPDGDAMIVAYSSGSEVRSVRVEPMTAVASLLVSTSIHDPSQASPPGMNEIFERLYKEARKGLEEKLAQVEEEPGDRSLRLSQEEMEKYIGIRNQMSNLIGVKYGINPDGGELLTFWGLETQPIERQLDVVKIMHIHFLLYFVSSKAETEDVGYQAQQVWPDDWPRILERFNLGNELYLGERFSKYVNYLKSHWEYHPGPRRPALVI